MTFKLYNGHPCLTSCGGRRGARRGDDVRYWAAGRHNVITVTRHSGDSHYSQLMLWKKLWQLYCIDIEEEAAKIQLQRGFIVCRLRNPEPSWVSSWLRTFPLHCQSFFGVLSFSWLKKYAQSWTPRSWDLEKIGTKASSPLQAITHPKISLPALSALFLSK